MKINENGIWINESGQPVKWWNSNEGNIIGNLVMGWLYPLNFLVMAILIMIWK